MIESSKAGNDNEGTVLMAVNQRGKNDQSVPPSIRHRCPNGHALKIPAKVAGKKVRCPKEGCTAVFVVPSPMPTAEPGPTGRSIETPADSTHVTDSAGRSKIAEVRNTNATERSFISTIGRIPVWVRITGGVVALAGVFVVGILIGTTKNNTPADEIATNSNVEVGSNVKEDDSTESQLTETTVVELKGKWEGNGQSLEVDADGSAFYSLSLPGPMIAPGSRQVNYVFGTIEIQQVKRVNDEFIWTVSIEGSNIKFKLVLRDTETLELIDTERNNVFTLKRKPANQDAAIVGQPAREPNNGPPMEVTVPNNEGRQPLLQKPGQAGSAAAKANGKASDDILTRAAAFLPSDYAGLLFTRPQTLLASPLLEKLLGFSKEQIGLSHHEVRSRLGFAFKDLDGIYLYVTSGGEIGASVVSSVAPFNAAKLRTTLNSSEADTHNGTTIYRMADGKAYYSVPRPTILLFASSEGEMMQALDRAVNPQRKPNLETGADLLVHITKFENFVQFAKSQGHSIPKESEDLAKRIHEMTLAVKVHDDLDFSTVLTTDNEESAKQVAIQLEAFKLLLSTALNEQIKRGKIQQGSPEEQIWSKLAASKISFVENQVRFHVQIDASLIEFLMKGSGGGKSEGKESPPKGGPDDLERDPKLKALKRKYANRRHDENAARALEKVVAEANKPIEWKAVFVGKDSTSLHFALPDIIQTRNGTRHRAQFACKSSESSRWDKIAVGTLVRFTAQRSPQVIQINNIVNPDGSTGPAPFDFVWTLDVRLITVVQAANDIDKQIKRRTVPDQNKPAGPLAKFEARQGKGTLILQDILFGKASPLQERMTEIGIGNNTYKVEPITISRDRRKDSDRLVLVFNVTEGYMPTVDLNGKCGLTIDTRHFTFQGYSIAASYNEKVEQLPPPPGALAIICVQNPLDNDGKPKNIVLTFQLPPSGNKFKLKGLKEFSPIEISIP